MTAEFDLDKFPVKNTIIVILILICLSLLGEVFFNESHNEFIEKNQKSAIKKAENTITQLEKENKTLSKQKQVIEKEALAYQADNQKLQSDLVKLKSSTKAKIQKAKTFTRSEIVDYYDKRYNIPNGAKTTALGTEITDSLAYENISELITFDDLKIENKNLVSQSKNYLSIIEKKEGIIQLTENEKTNLNSMLAQKEIVIKSKDTLLNSEKEKTKKERRAKRLWKIAAIGLGATTIYQQVK